MYYVTVRWCRAARRDFNDKIMGLQHSRDVDVCGWVKRWNTTSNMQKRMSLLLGLGLDKIEIPDELSRRNFTTLPITGRSGDAMALASIIAGYVKTIHSMRKECPVFQEYY